MNRSVIYASFLFFRSRSCTKLTLGLNPGKRTLLIAFKKVPKKSALPVPWCDTARKRHALMGDIYVGSLCLFRVIVAFTTYERSIR